MPRTLFHPLSQWLSAAGTGEFARPGWLWLLLALPPLAAWAARGRRRREADWAALGQSGRPRSDGSWGWVGAIACLILALAQPRWGRKAGTDLPPGHDVVILMDVSRSMGAEDAVPDRLGLAVEAAEGLIEALAREPGPRAAVVAFSGRGAARCPLTDDLGAAVEALRALRPGEVQPGGTDLGAALASALDVFDDQEAAGGRTVVLFTDGEDHAGHWPRIVSELRAARVVVHAVAVGDPERGHPVPSGVGAKPLAYQGREVASRRVDAPLEALAKETGGAFVPMGLAPADLGSLYADRIAPVALRRKVAPRAGDLVEWFPVPLLAALATGLAGSWPRRGRRPSRPRRRFALAGSLAALALVNLGAGGPSPAGAVAEGMRASALGDDRAALAAFDRAIALDPAAALPRFDAAAALFRLGRFDEAAARYREARERADPPLRAKIDYALGNTALALGDVPGALRRYDACLASKAVGPGLDAVRRDAAINRKFAEQLARPAEPTEPPDRPKADTPKAPSDTPRPQEPPEGRPPNPKSPRPGGAKPTGKAGKTPPPPGSPEAQLADALERVRDSMRRRLDDGPPPPADPNLKDW